MAVVGYSPFGSTGGFPTVGSPGGKVLKEIADAHSATVHQIALSFLTRRDSLFSIPKAANPKHAADNSVAGNLKLSKEDIDKIESAFPLGRRPGSLPMI